MYIAISGDGTPVMFLHGAGVSGWMWEPVQSMLRVDVKAVVPDLPGFGRSSNHVYPGHSEVVAELVGVLRDASPKGVVVVGFSLGAQLALLLSATHPELVRGAVVVSAETEPAHFQRATLALLSATAPLAKREWFARLQGSQLAVPAHLMDRYVRDSKGMSRATLLASVAENIRFTLPAPPEHGSTPMHIMVGGNERPVMLRSARSTAAARSHATLDVVSGAGHDLPFTRPELVANAIGDVLHWD
jgi:pimeloyl-ACP methyl ester carboxylesterase